MIHGVLDPDGKEWGAKTDGFRGLPLFDEVTEGYNIIPNFFVSGIVDEKLFSKESGAHSDSDYYKDNELHLAQRKDKDNQDIDDMLHQWQFQDRLFDRSSLFLSHYDINFLFVLKTYARMKSTEVLNFKVEAFVRENFYDLHGHVFSFKQGNETILLYAAIRAVNEQQQGTVSSNTGVRDVGSDSAELTLSNGRVVELKEEKFGERIEKFNLEPIATSTKTISLSHFHKLIILLLQKIWLIINSPWPTD